MSDSTLDEPTGRSSGRGKIVVAALCVVILFVGRSYLPIGTWLTEFNVWVSGLGPTGIVIFILVYVLAAVLFIPGSILTIGAGAIFGLVRGTIIVSVASTTAAAAAFLISRYLARGWVERKAGRNPKFEAIDRAIGREGGKIVGLLRLTPAIPFSLSNYLYGLTAVRFLPYVIASWLGMLPGTVLYVYVGVATKAGVQAAAGGRTRTWQEYAFMGIGLVATVAVTVLITRIARRALDEAAAEEEPA